MATRFEMSGTISPSTQETLVVRGGTPLVGTVSAAGAKNSALKLLPAAILAPGRNTVKNVPLVTDVFTMLDVLEAIGISHEIDGHTVVLDVPKDLVPIAPYALTSKMRASIQVLGPLLARFGSAQVAMPGGCNLGSRKLDMHLRALEEMGAVFETVHGDLVARADKLVGKTINLDFPSVGATENVLLAAVAAEGETVIENAAREPEISNLCDMLVGMGIEIEGAGTSTIRIQGGDVHSLKPVSVTVIPDRIETGTYLIASAISNGDVTVKESNPMHHDMLLSKLVDIGATVDTGQDWIRVRGADSDFVPETSKTRSLKAVDVITLPYPGFPTDLQPQIVSLLSLARGVSLVTENVFDGRYQFVNELNRMGADIRTDGRHAVVKGVEGLSGAPVQAPDIRAGAALVCAGLAAQGETSISNVHFIDRGYEDLVGKLRSLGAQIERVPAGAPH